MKQPACREDIEQATAAFLANGGTITHLEPEVYAEPLNRRLSIRVRLTWRKRRDWEERNAARTRRGRV